MIAAEDFKSLSQERYSRFARRYVTSEGHARGSELDRLVDIARPQPDWIILDVATGGGHTALKFAPFVARVVATDITPGMLEQAAAFVAGQGGDNVEFRLAAAEALPFGDGAFDLVTCRIAPHHFADCPRFVRQGARVLRAGGLLLVQDHLLPEDGESARYIDAFERLRDPSHHRAYATSEWLAMFQAAGLQVEHTEQIVKRHEFLLWAGRQDCTPDVIERLIQMVAGASDAVVEWLEPHDFDTPHATFVNRHLIIAGRRC
jgi:ubiquinone/menaquinone biosynthesis C-methylase UbiE